jgi:hypothetical protein
MLYLLLTNMTFSYFHAMIVLQGGGRMQFGFLNLTGFLIVALMMIPNLIYALRNPHIENKCFCKPMLIVEQIGRYGSMAMMVFPLFVWEFGFKSPEELVIWLFLLPALLAGLFHFLGGLFSQAVAARRVVAGDPAQCHLHSAGRDFSGIGC